MHLALELVANGILLGGLYALIACGLNLIFGVMRVINFAHGEFVALGALLAFSLVVGFQLPYWLAILVVPMIAGIAGFGLQALLLHRIVGGPMINSLLMTYALSIVLVNIGILIWGGGFKGLPTVGGSSVHVLGLDLSESRLLAFAIAMAASVGVYLFLKLTMFGKAVRAVSEEPEVATVCAIPATLVRNVTFAVGAAMAGLGGVLIAPIFAVDPQMGARFIIKAFAVIVIGGLGSYAGAALTAIALGVIEVVSGYHLGQVAGTAMLYLLMILFLIFRPSGLFAVKVRA